MSRALDSEVAASLKNGNSQAAFHAISEVLDPASSEELLEIEILKGSYLFEPGTHVMKDGPAIAVSKLGLVQAYFFALQIVKHHTAEGCRATPLTRGEEDKLFSATAIMLLMDPEHLTAANTRKRIIKAYSDKEAADTPRLEELIILEKRFIDSLLTSHLHRHTKSPTIWSHRRWLVPHFIRHRLFNIEKDISDIVMVAAERHPRNYYAWHHARMLQSLVGVPAEPVRERLEQAMFAWCTRHHDDVSGWSFLRHLLLKDGWYDAGRRASVVRKTHKLARSMRWTNESVWWFLRTAAPLDPTTTGLDDINISHSKITYAVGRRSALPNPDGLPLGEKLAGADAKTAIKVLDSAKAWYMASHKPSEDAGS
jgi:hypothetical protein